MGITKIILQSYSQYEREEDDRINEVNWAWIEVLQNYNIPITRICKLGVGQFNNVTSNKVFKYLCNVSWEAIANLTNLKEVLLWIKHQNDFIWEIRKGLIIGILTFNSRNHMHNTKTTNHNNINIILRDTRFTD